MNGATSNGTTRFRAFRHLRQLLRITEIPRWATPTLIVVGVVASFAETLGISLIVLFVYSAMGQLDPAGSQPDTLGLLLHRVSVVFDNSTELSVFVFLLILGRGGLAFANNMVSARMSEQLSERLRNMIHKQYLSISYSSVQKYEQSQLIETLGPESWAIADAYMCAARVIISASSVVVFSFFLIGLSWTIALITGLGVLLLSLGMRRLWTPARRLGERVKKVHEDLYGRMLFTLDGLRTIRAYGLEDSHHQQFLNASAEARRSSLSFARLSAFQGPLAEIGYLAILCLIMLGVGHWEIGFPTTMAAVAVIFRLQPHTREFEGNLLQLARLEPQLRSVLGMIRADNKEYPSVGHVDSRLPRQDIRFEDVSFQYDREASPVLSNVSFSIPVGSTTALIGPSGAGKTTIINLLLRLYEPTSGQVLVDDVPLNELKRTQWLRQLAVAGQDVELVEGTVLDNILMARADATEAQVVAAARKAGVAEFVESRPDGYQTWIGQQGLKFSGGQRQRIGLARALLRDPQVLLLDEATAALDDETADRIWDAIQAQLKGRTILVITHRVESASRADYVVRLDDGKVSEVTATNSSKYASEAVRNASAIGATIECDSTLEART